jgi:ribokinase
MDTSSRTAAVDLLSVGEAFEDLVFGDLPRLPNPGEEIKTSQFVRTVGGGTVITAVAAARLGLRCRVLSALSPAAVDLLSAEKISVTNLRRPDELHAVSAALSTRTERTFVTYNGVNDQLESRLAGPCRKARARHVHFAFYPSDCAVWTGIAADLKRHAISTSWDFGWNDRLLKDEGFPGLLQALDYVFLNEQEAVLYSGKPDLAAAFRHWRHNRNDVVIKLGARGCRWISPARQLRSPAHPVSVVDTTGAGDAFNGGFLFALLSRRSPVDCLRIANWVGGLSTRSAGGINALPRREELE